MPLHTEHSVVEMTGNIGVCCPEGDRFMTPYVLKEQNDWFEDEIKFMRKIVHVDTKFIDIGANYGLYSLAIAKLSPQGHVWAYEPCAKTADYMRESIRINELKNVSLIQKAMSNRLGTGRLLNHNNSELNALSVSDDGGEVISLTTMDSQFVEHAWGDVDIVKIDAEGHELQIIEGGKTFFATASPLVMSEITAVTKTDLGPTRLLMEYGYKPYQLIPGLSALAPQDIEKNPDAYQLNIFSCKQDLANKLSAEGKLVIVPGEVSKNPPNIWEDFITSFPYGRESRDLWQLQSSSDGWHDYERALNFYALSRSLHADIAVRYSALTMCYEILGELVRKTVTVPRLVSYARVAADIGARNISVKTFESTFQALNVHDSSLKEPFICPCEEFEAIAPNGKVQAWMTSSLLNHYEKARGYSSYFTHPVMTLQIVGDLKRLGFCTPQMERRGDLATRRMPKPSASQ